jgi:hypothetical protein
MGNGYGMECQTRDETSQRTIVFETALALG